MVMIEEGKLNHPIEITDHEHVPCRLAAGRGGDLDDILNSEF